MGNLVRDLVPRDGSAGPSNGVADVTHLQFYIDPGDGVAHYHVDLTEFAIGGKHENQPPITKRLWRGDFTGRPGFARQFADMIQLARPAKPTTSHCRAAMRMWFRFLDLDDEHRSIDDVSAITDVHGAKFRKWLKRNGYQDATYGDLKSTLDQMREINGLPRLYWDKKSRPAPAELEDVDEQGVRRLYHALKEEARLIKAMFREGKRLADSGSDPRKRAQSGREEYPWRLQENHAWLIRKLSWQSLPSRNEVVLAGASILFRPHSASEWQPGPSYLAPGMDASCQGGVVGKMRWFHPALHDTIVFLWLFLMGTGWNLATALALDVSKDENWFETHPQSPKFVILHSFKRRAGRHVFAPCLRKPEWHPYQIVKYMIGKTRSLRRTLRRQLREAQDSQSKCPTADGAATISELEAQVKSPWLFCAMKEVGAVGAISSDHNGRINAVARLAAMRKPGLVERHPKLRHITTSIVRDAWIGYAYVRSGYNWTLAWLASQHGDRDRLDHYLKRASYREFSEQQTRRWQNAVFSEILDGRPLDPTRVRILVSKGKITAEQEARLLDFRSRTRLGMGCLEPREPPREIAPDHVKGMLCRSQRCTLCNQGVVFQESLRPLARSAAELIFLQGLIPLTAWLGSSFETELQSLLDALQLFPADQVAEEMETWRLKLVAGEVLAHDTYPAY